MSKCALRVFSAHSRLLCSFVLLPASSGRDTSCSPWVATWGDDGGGRQRERSDISGQTLRLIVHTSIGGPQTRIWLSNRFGTVPLQAFGAAHIGRCRHGCSPKTRNADMSAIKATSDRALTFDHMSSVTISPGATIVSDAVQLDVRLFPILQ